jgi:hypothetical protein
MRHLICTLGTSPIPVWVAVKHHLEQLEPDNLRVHLLTSDSAHRLQTSAALIEVLNNLPLPSPPTVWKDANLEFDPQKLRAQLATCVKHEVGGGDEVYVNITGGTKVMALIAARWAEDSGYTWEYISSDTGRIHRSDNSLSDFYELPDAATWLYLQTGSQPAKMSRNGPLPRWMTNLLDNGAILWQTGNEFSPRFHEEYLLRREGERLELIFGMREGIWWDLAKKRDFRLLLLSQRFINARQKLDTEYVDAYLLIPEQLANAPVALPSGLNGIINKAERTEVGVWYADDKTQNIDFQTAEYDGSEEGSDQYEEPTELDPPETYEYALVSLVGDEPIPTLMGLQYHLDHHPDTAVGCIYLLTSLDTINVAERICEQLQSDNNPFYEKTIIIPTEPKNPEILRDDIATEIRASKIGLNATGGTKLMSLSSLNELYGKLDYAIYMDSENVVDLLQPIPPGQQRPRASYDLSLESFFSLHGVETGPNQNKNFGARFEREVYDALEELLSKEQEAGRILNFKTSQSLNVKIDEQNDWTDIDVGCVIDGRVGLIECKLVTNEHLIDEVPAVIIKMLSVLQLGNLLPNYVKLGFATTAHLTSSASARLLDQAEISFQPGMSKSHVLRRVETLIKNRMKLIPN